MSRFLIDRYASLEPYTPGEQPQDMQYIKLNTNEFPYPPAPEVLAAVNADAAAQLRLYCDPECAALRQALGENYGVPAANIFTANGSDDILNFAFQAFAGAQKPAFFPDVTYGFYKVFGALHGVDCTELPLRDDFTVDPADYYRRDGMVVLANPNAPTGIALTRDQIARIVQENPDQVVLIDEAYVDFGAESCVPLTARYDNLLVVMTYSKSRALAGARLGFAIGSRGLIEDLERIKYSTNPYNVNRITQACGTAAARFDGYYRSRCAEIAATRDFTAAALREMGFRVLPSQANFLFAEKPGMDGAALYQALRRRGILVRHFTQPRIRQFNRITVGTRGQMDVLLAAVKEITEGGTPDEKR